MSELIPFTTNDVMARIIKIRGQEVLLDRDVAELYGVETKRINEALRNTLTNSQKGMFSHCNPLRNRRWSKISTGSRLSNSRLSILMLSPSEVYTCWPPS